jgi:UDPglucose--hexose-1-phosphate uridylyltransferase
LNLSVHRRFNPLNREWVLVSPQRTQRPWQGQVEKVSQPAEVAYDPRCYLCPGNSRAGGVKNPNYSSTFVFENDFAALRMDSPADCVDQEGLLIACGERGACRVVCFSPNHSLTMSRMDVPSIHQVVETWTQQYIELGSMELIRHVQIFENRGEMMGASNPHPHCQIWATESLPNEIVKEDAGQLDYYQKNGRCLLCDYLALEQKAGERIVCENESFVVLVPYWAVWPFETMIVMKRHTGGLDEFSGAEQMALADILKRITTRYDNLFETPFPNSLGLHQKPTDGVERPHHHFHAHFFPPLLRSATVKKFMVGYELLAGPQRDITAEDAAARLRALSEIHYAEGTFRS